MKQRRLTIITLVVLCQAVLLFLVPTQVVAQTCADAYEPDETDAPWIGNGESQARTFCPEGDVDRARFRVKAGHWYDVHTYDLGRLVDTTLTVEGAELFYEDDDGGGESLASRIYFQAPTTGEVIITVVNSQGVYSMTQSYQLYAGEAAAPTPTATATPTSTSTPTPTSTPTATPRPTREPPPTATPAMPIINFAASPERVARPGDCVTLRWHVERAAEVFLVYPNGSQEGVVGQDERQVCPLETSVYALEVSAPGGNQTVEVEVAVPLPTHTPMASSQMTPLPTGSSGGGSPKRGGQGTIHVVVFVDENRSKGYDPQEGVLGATVLLMSQAAPGQVWSRESDALGQVPVEEAVAGSYRLLIPHLGRAQTVNYRQGDLTLDVLVPAIQLPARIP